jgi:hypothetical protein
VTADPAKVGPDYKLIWIGAAPRTTTAFTGSKNMHETHAAAGVKHEWVESPATATTTKSGASTSTTCCRSCSGEYHRVPAALGLRHGSGLPAFRLLPYALFCDTCGTINFADGVQDRLLIGLVVDEGLKFFQRCLDGVFHLRLLSF